MTTPYTHRRTSPTLIEDNDDQRLERITSQSCHLGYGGRVWDISNLSSHHRRTQPKKQPSRSFRNLYPSRSSVRDIPDDHITTLFEKRPVGIARTKSFPTKQLGFMSSYTLPTTEERVARKRANGTPVSFHESIGSAGFGWSVASSEDVDDSSNNSCCTMEYDYDDDDENCDMNKKPAPKQQTTSSCDEVPTLVSTQPTMEIEVCPGYFLPVRGADETVQAIMERRIKRTSCTSCENQLFCTTAAEYVLCPVCRVVSPIDCSSFSRERRQQISGVGLGLTRESLARECRNLGLAR